MNTSTPTPRTARSRKIRRTLVVLGLGALLALLPVVAWAGVSVGIHVDHHGHVAYSIGVFSGYHHHSTHLGYHHRYRPHHYAYPVVRPYYPPIPRYRYDHRGHHPAYRPYRAPHRAYHPIRPHHGPKLYSRPNY